jgi:hypothetical protein
MNMFSVEVIEYRGQNISFLLDFSPSALFLIWSGDSTVGVVIRL